MVVFMEILRGLLSQLGMIVLAAFILSKSKFLKQYVIKANLTVYDQLFFAIIFGVVGILGTYTGVPINGAIANSRAIGVIVAGLIGGPFVGAGAGLIAGLHRMFFATGQFTAIPCGISTFLGGALAGYLKAYVDHKDHRWLYAMGVAMIIESIQMLIIILIARPLKEAISLVQLIFIPMTLINGFGAGAFMLLVEQIYEEKEKAGAVKAALALSIANQTLPYLRTGLNAKSAIKTAEIIYRATGVMAVSLTDRDAILAHVGAGDDHHKTGRSIFTRITKRAIEEGQVLIAKDPKGIECSQQNCPLKAVIVVPLKSDEEVVGTLKLYTNKVGSITSSDIELAKGLGHLFSTQLELSRIERQKTLIARAELKALQAQIQPHFLFNALNTIVSFCRTKPDKARSLLLQLSFYLRANFKELSDFVLLDKEMDYVKAYLAIEEARFGQRLKVVYDLVATEGVMIPSLTLQPLVENGVKHGLLPLKEGGTITIRTAHVPEGLRLTVEDDGVGMPREQERALLNLEEKREGIGVINVHQRLLNIYGKGLTIESKENEGTVISFVLPKERRVTYESDTH